MKRVALFASVCILTLGIIPEGILPFGFGAVQAEAQSLSRGGGFGAMPRREPSGAKARIPSNASRPVTTPSRPTRPVTRPNNERPPQPVTRPPQTRPPVANPPPNRPPEARPPGLRPPGARPPVSRPPVAPPIYRPPLRPRPPGWRPPYYRPPLWRPPYWRPPYYLPPYVRPPHYVWGPYFWYPRWGWYFTATIGTATLVYVATLPEDKECTRTELDGETVYICDGVLYRATYYQDEQVYEIVSEPEEVVEDD